MTYDPFTDSFGPDGGDFDPLSPDDVEDVEGEEHRAFSIPAGDIPVGTIGSLSYDRGDNEIVGVPTQVDRDDVARPRRGFSKVERDQAERREHRAGTDTGVRNVGRAAATVQGGTREGGDGRGDEIAGTIESAASQLLQSIRGTGGARTGQPTGQLGWTPVRVAARVKSHGEHTYREDMLGKKIIEFECEVYGVKMNSAGDWMLTVRVPYKDRGAITELGGVTGLNLMTRMESMGLTDDNP